MKKIQIGKNGKVNLIWNVKPCDYTKEKEKSIASKFARKYEIPESIVSVTVNYLKSGEKDESLNAENIENVHDPKFQQQLFKDYIAEYGIEGYDFEEILKIDSQINSLIDYDSYEKSRRYSIKWVKWDNFLSYGDDNFFDFTKLKGLVLLNGQPANESGKSTFAYDLLHFLLFGKTQSEKAATMENLFNNYRPETTKVAVEGCITIDGNDYIIKRILTRPSMDKKTRKITSKVEFFKVNSDNSLETLSDGMNLQEESTVKTTKVIKEALGNESDFDRIISANSKDLDSLISMKETERGRLLSRWIGLSVLEDKDKLARDKWNKEVSKKRYCDLYDKSTLENEIDEKRKKIKETEELIKTESKRKSDAEGKKEREEKVINDLLALKKPVDNDLLKVDFNTVKSGLEMLKEKGLGVSAKVDILKKRMDEMGEIEFSEEEYSQLRKESEKITGLISSHTAEVKNLNRLNESLSKAEFCPTCGRKFDNVDNTGKITENQEKIKTLTSEIAKLSERKGSVAEKMANIEQLRKSKAEKDKLFLSISALNTELAQLRIDYQEKKNLLNRLQTNKEKIEENNKIETSIKVAQENIKAETKVINETISIITRLTSLCESDAKSILEKKSIISHIEEERKIERNWKIYLQLIGKDGITKLVLKKTLPIINNELNRLLNDVSDFNMKIEINDKNDVDFWLLRDGVKTKLSAASGLERTEASLALRVVLGQMSNLSKPPFILLDEILGTVSKESYDKMKTLYDKITGFYDFILHITHISDITDWHNQVITVIKENNISRISI